MKKSVKFISFIFIILVLLFGTGFFYLKSQLQAISKESEPSYKRVEIPSGMSVTGISKVLKDENLIKNQKLFYYMARYPKLLKLFYKSDDLSAKYVLKSGIYYISPNMNYVEILNLLSSGQTEYVKVSIPEGLTISKIAALLEENRVCNASDFVYSAKNPDILKEFNIAGVTAEGFLFPDTYFFNLGMKSDVVVSTMIQNFYKKIKSVPNLAEMTPADLYNTVNLASIVEREYKIDEEAPLIASVFKNRLRINMGFYSCATVEYIITEIQGKPHPERILNSDLKIESPYNTYLHAGLPPTPISNPGLVALNAATNTPKTKYYYFQIIDSDLGKHVFEETFEDHISNH